MRETVAGYRVVSVLGEGGMGTVYLARHPRMGRLEAVKVIRPDLAALSHVRERFLREAALAASVQHPALLPVYDHDDVDGDLYIAMKWVEGVNLQQWGRTHREPAAVVEGLTQVAEGLDALHARGLVHRDVKPSNIMVATSSQQAGAQRWYLMDFGIARSAEHPAVPGAATALGGFVGSVAYSAPERFAGDPGTAASDVYALAVTLHQALTGELPFGSSVRSVLGGHESGRRPDSFRLLPRALRPVLSAGLATASSRRPATCCELVARAQRALDHRPSWRRALPVAAPGRWTGRRVVVGAAAASAVVAVVASAVAVQATTRAATRPSAARAAVPSAPDYRSVALPSCAVGTEATVDVEGAVWVAGGGGCLVRVTAAGEVSTVAVSGANRDEDGARAPQHLLAADPTGGVWLADGGVLHRLTSEGEVSSVQARDLAAFAISSSGVLWVTSWDGAVRTLDGGTWASPEGLAAVAADAVRGSAVATDDAVWWAVEDRAGGVTAVRREASGAVTSAALGTRSLDGGGRRDLVAADDGRVWWVSDGTLTLLDQDLRPTSTVPTGAEAARDPTTGPAGRLVWLDSGGESVGVASPGEDGVPQHLLDSAVRQGTALTASPAAIWVVTARRDASSTGSSAHPALLTVVRDRPAGTDPLATDAQRQQVSAVLATGSATASACGEPSPAVLPCLMDAMTRRDEALAVLDLPPVSREAVEQLRSTTSQLGLRQALDQSATTVEVERQVYAVDEVRTAVGLPRVGAW